MIAKYDIATKKWTISEVPTSILEKEPVSVSIGFTNKGKVGCTFDNLSYGINVSDDGAPDKTFITLPPFGTALISSDQEFEYSGLITDLTVGVSTVTFWAENAGNRVESSVDIVASSAVYVLVPSSTTLGDSSITVDLITPPDPSSVPTE